MTSQSSRSPRSQRDESPEWSRASRTRHGLRAPMGLNILSVILLCGTISIIIDLVGERLDLPGLIIYPVIAVANFAILAVAIVRMSAINKSTAEAQREIYKQKFEKNIEAIKEWSERRRSGPQKTMEPGCGLTYEDAGVSIDTKMAALDEVKRIIRTTYRPEVLSDMGYFGGLFALDKAKYEEPVLVSSNDSVGTKLKLAFMTGRHDTVGYDIVAHCANDILVLGAEPLFFLDYIGTSKVEPQVMVQLMEGLAAGCKDTGCALVGGETAELPSFYQVGEYDLAGTIVGVVERKKIITGEKIKPGDCVIGMASAGLHTNGFALARKIMFEVCGYSVGDFVQELDTTVGDELLKSHRSYAKPLLWLIRKFNMYDFRIKGLAHITGGGMLDNIPRILPENCSAEIKKGTWNIPPIFPFLQEKGNVAENEMYRVFNMGIGIVMVVAAEYADRILNELKASQETVYTIGNIIKGDRTVILS